MILQGANSQRSVRRRRIDGLFKLVCMLAAGVGVVLLVLFLAKIVIDGLPRLTGNFIMGGLSSQPKRAGIWPAILGSIYVMILTGIFAVPVGVAAAVYLEEFNQRKTPFANFVQLNIANLAGVPSIVFGLLGLAVFVRWFALGQSVIAGALTMSLLILPMVIIVTQEALKAVPRSYREASLALGSTPWQAIRFQVLPNAAAGILTGVILSVSRAIGETAPLIVVGAASFVSAPKEISKIVDPQNFREKYTVLPIKIFDWSQAPQQGFHSAAASAILVLIVTLLLLNSTAIFLRARAGKKK